MKTLGDEYLNVTLPKLLSTSGGLTALMTPLFILPRTPQSRDAPHTLWVCPRLTPDISKTDANQNLTTNMFPLSLNLTPPPSPRPSRIRPGWPTKGTGELSETGVIYSSWSPGRPASAKLSLSHQLLARARVALMLMEFIQLKSRSGEATHRLGRRRKWLLFSVTGSRRHCLNPLFWVLPPLFAGIDEIGFWLHFFTL